MNSVVNPVFSGEVLGDSTLAYLEKKVEPAKPTFLPQVTRVDAKPVEKPAQTYTLETLPTVKTKGRPAQGYQDIKLSESLREISVPASALDKTTGFKKGAQIKFGSVTMTITQGYQFRSNTGKHSTGMDYVTNDGSVVSVTDGEIVEVGVQGPNRPLLAFQKDAAGETLMAAGQYIKVRTPENIYVYYMHLDPLAPEDIKQLTGRKIKRGETFGKNVGFFVGSGTMTGAHVKIKILKNGQHINPARHILYGKN